MTPRTISTALLLFFTCAVADANAQAIRRALWVEPEQINLADPKVVERILDQPAERIVVSYFVGGETLVANQTNFFPQMPAYERKGDVLTPLVQKAQAKGKSVVVYLDCL